MSHSSAPTIDDREDMFVPAAELAVMFTEAAAMLRARCGLWLLLAGHRRVMLLLGEHPTGTLFWLVAPQHEGRFLLMLPWSEQGEALINVTDQDWPEVQRWRMLARQPITLALPSQPVGSQS
jgi:hypothetical protein